MLGLSRCVNSILQLCEREGFFLCYCHSFPISRVSAHSHGQLKHMVAKQENTNPLPIMIPSHIGLNQRCVCQEVWNFAFGALV